MTITDRANQIISDPEFGHELTIDRAMQIAQEEAEEATNSRRQQARKRELWAAFKAELRDAGVSDAAMKALTDPAVFHDLPERIAFGHIRFSDRAKERAVKAAIRNLWIAIGYGEPRFDRAHYETLPGVGSLRFPG